jgi:hypothetical protein
VLQGFRWEVPSLDFLRRRLTSGLQVEASKGEVRRGEEVEALVTISSSRGLADVEVGLVCTESYAYESTSTDTEGHSYSSRGTAEACAHEAWVPVEGVAGVQASRFAIPSSAPFSYAGDCLSFRWEIVARGRRSHRLDAQVRREISVLP